MKDNEVRGIVLQEYYDRRREGTLLWSNNAVQKITSKFGIDHIDLFRACDQLAEHGLISWEPVRMRGYTAGGAGEISAFGVDVIEGEKKAPIAINLGHNISIHSSPNVQIGNNNVQDVKIEFEKIIGAINKSDATNEEKAEAKSLLKQYLEHPVVAAVIGGLASTIKF